MRQEKCRHDARLLMQREKREVKEIQTSRLPEVFKGAEVSSSL